VKLGILGRGYTQRCLSLYKNRITEKVFPVFPVRPCVAEKVQPVGSTYLCEALDQTPLPHLVNHPKGPWWATNALEQDLCRVLRSGQYESSGLLWRPEWRGGIVYHIFVCICIFLGKWIHEAGGGGMTPT
jgi:hypothetical protein